MVRPKDTKYDRRYDPSRVTKVLSEQTVKEGGMPHHMRHLSNRTVILPRDEDAVKKDHKNEEIEELEAEED